MNCFRFAILRKIFELNYIGNKAWCLKTAGICASAFSTHPVNNNRGNILQSERERFLWLSSARHRKTKAEDLIPKIVNKIEAEPYFFDKVQEICKDLKHILPAAEIKVFGSAGSNLALWNADVDIAIQLKELDRLSKEAILIIKGKLQRSKLFIKACAIFAQVPIIKCVHRNGVSCDLSFSSYLGLYDSELIKFVLNIDNRIRPLILMLKFLFKRENLMLNTHCLVVMTLFFLQSLENPLVPPISYLQDLAEEKKMFEGWDISYTREISRLPKISNQSSIIELLQQFFQFYAAFEFGFQVISVFAGKTYLKPVFANPDLLPEQFDLYKRKVAEDESLKFNCNSYMCIQGIFNHSVNISKNFMEKHVKDFQDYCRVNAALGQELLYGDDSEEPQLEFLIKLFQKKKEETFNEIPDLLAKEVVLVLQNVSLHDVNSSPDDFRNKWWNSVLDNILEILRDVMDGEVSLESRKLSCESSDLVEENVISCKMPYWELATKIRNQVAKTIELPNDMSGIEREKLISDRLKKTLLGNVEKKSLKFEVICGFKKNPTRVSLKFEPKFENKKHDGFLLNACFYLAKHISKWAA